MNRRKRIRRGMIAAAACGLVTAGASLPAPPSSADTLELTGVLRDFKRGDSSGGHPDFQTAGSMGRFGHVKGMTTMSLDDDDKPTYNPTRPNKDTMQSETSFKQWYRDDPTINAGMPHTLSLSNGQQEAGGVYTYASNAFWPIDGKLFGNEGLNHNFHFTFELKTTFTYRPGHFFTFVGDDDVWVYINGKKVIDLGGVHGAVTGSVLLINGKAFVENEDFGNEAEIKTADNALAAMLQQHWDRLDLPGNSPVVSGDKYVDLGMLAPGAPEARCVFNGTSVTAFATAKIQQVVIQFVDGSTQVFDNIDAYTGTYAGTEAYEGKPVVGCWVKAEGDASEQGIYTAANGGEAHDAKLNFFFAERHTTQSNFQIETSIKLTSESPATISPLYD